MDFFSIFKNFTTLNFLAYAGLLFLISQAFGRIANYFKSPHIIGYLLSGILFGPYVLNLFSKELIYNDLAIITDITLSIIAFSIGGSLKIKILKKYDKSILFITIFQAIGAFLFVFIFSMIFLPFITNTNEANNGFIKTFLPISLILGSVSIATAPAAILSILHEYKAKKGSFSNVLLGIVSLDDVIALIFYSFTLVIAKNLVKGESFAFSSAFISPLLTILFSLFLGILVGFLIKLIIKFFKPKDMLLGIVLGSILLTGGIALSFNISPLLSNMVLGFFVQTFISHDKANEAFDVIESIEEPIFGLFFLIAGAFLNISFVFKASILTLIILSFRFLGKYSGSYYGAYLSNSKKSIKKYIGLSLFPSAGIAIGLILEAEIIFSPIIPFLSALMVNAVIGQILINELISPYFVRYSLKKAKEI
ncbi:MAG: hypothetical protein K1060chlam5_00876 [Candidatus Anoxychlamydiales bacterium]|nr:hypothetical protein [Candidatus Anoxychlamydiales bacterium]